MRGHYVASSIVSALKIAIFVHAAAGNSANAEARSEVPAAHAASHGPVGTVKKWRLELGTYIWAPAVNGDVTVDGQRIPIDASVSDIVKDADSLFAFNLAFVARKGQWGLLVQPRYMKLGADSGEPLMVKVASRLLVGEVSGIYTFFQNTFRGAFGNAFAVDAIWGLRLWWLGVQVKAVDGLVTGQDYQVWVDPLVGLIARLDLLDGHFPVVLRGDLGGWAVGSTVAWSAGASAGYRWFRPKFDIALGVSYRALAAD